MAIDFVSCVISINKNIYLYFFTMQCWCITWNMFDGITVKLGPIIGRKVRIAPIDIAIVKNPIGFKMGFQITIKSIDGLHMTLSRCC